MHAFTKAKKYELGFACSFWYKPGSIEVTYSKSIDYVHTSGNLLQNHVVYRKVQTSGVKAKV